MADWTMRLPMSPFQKDLSTSNFLASLCSPLSSSLSSSESCSSISSESSASSNSLTPSVQFVASKQCQALILSPVRVANFFATRKRLYKKDVRRQLASEGAAAASNDGQDINNNSNISLGEGGFGAVFRSSYNNHDVAIKQLYQKRHSPSSDFVSLCAELNAFRLPPSPYVVPILSFTSSGTSIQASFS
ncbi:unnamed protein product [Anisakis simplex]|uniref:Proto-oncogene serine/threonine-protein kinase mos (inferred by orthology to a human protein) n=1 Tax=Anisakis simplex TaxID=6269 RepID=A0A0M3J071_ANISI|nr:unnamed protein product [Anisakis simplex]